MRRSTPNRRPPGGGYVGGGEESGAVPVAHGAGERRRNNVRPLSGGFAIRFDTALRTAIRARTEIVTAVEAKTVALTLKSRPKSQYSREPKDGHCAPEDDAPL